MPRLIPAALLSAAALSACSPTFNWREVRAQPAALKAMLPCKPDKAQREVPMAGRQVQLQALGCEAGGATFALFSADVVDAGRSGEALAQWKLASLANIRAAGAQERAFLPPGGMALRESLVAVASGKRADGSDVESQAAYFARGSSVFQAVIYAPRIKPEWADTFFSGLKFE